MIWKNSHLFLSKFLKVFFVLAIFFHFIILGMFQMPDNPIKHQYKYEMSNYINPFFSQRWTLFAPNPISSNRSLLYRYAYQKGTVKDTTDWIDVTEPLIEIRKKDFWSPIQRISKFTESSMSSVYETHIKLLKFIQKTDSLKDNSEKASCFYKKNIVLDDGYKSIIIYSDYVQKRFFNKNNMKPDSIKVQFKIYNAKFPRFSKRKEDYYNLDNYTFNELEFFFTKLI